MKADVLIVTCARDEWWFCQTLPLILSRLSGFRRIVAVAPEQDRHIFEPVKNVHWNFIPDWSGKGYFWQQWVKINGPAYCPDADWIVHIDSDIFIKKPVSLQDFDRAWLMAQYATLPPLPWKGSTEQHCGFSVQYEYMRAFPFIINTQTHRLTQEILNRFGKPFSEYIAEQTVFSEFNVMGAIAHKHHPELYNWIDLSYQIQEPAPFSRVHHAWIKPPPDEAQAYVDQLVKP